MLSRSRSAAQATFRCTRSNEALTLMASSAALLYNPFCGLRYYRCNYTFVMVQGYEVPVRVWFPTNCRSSRLLIHRSTVWISGERAGGLPGWSYAHCPMTGVRANLTSSRSFRMTGVVIRLTCLIRINRSANRFAFGHLRKDQSCETPRNFCFGIFFPSLIHSLVCLCFTRAVSDFVDAAGRQTGTKTVVVGESFGGMLSLRLGQLRWPTTTWPRRHPVVAVC